MADLPNPMLRVLAFMLVPAILLAQVAAGVSPGRSLCVVLEACCGDLDRRAGSESAPQCIRIAHAEAHAHDRPHAHHDHPDGGAREAGEGEAGEGHGPLGDAGEPRDGCDGSDAHFHLTVPDDAGSLRSEWSMTQELAGLDVVDLPESLLVDPGARSRARRAGEPPPWIWPTSDQRVSIETDRLLI